MLISICSLTYNEPAQQPVDSRGRIYSNILGREGCQVWVFTQVTVEICQAHVFSLGGGEEFLLE